MNFPLPKGYATYSIDKDIYLYTEEEIVYIFPLNVSPVEIFNAAMDHQCGLGVAM